MTIIIFLIDTSASMMQKSYLGTTYLDFAKLAVEQFLKLRQRDPASNGDRYMLMTFDEYPQNIRSGWKESQRIFNEQLKNLKIKGSMNFESSLESVFRLLTVSRMQSGSGAGIETYGFGRYPSYAEHVVIIPVIDGSFLPPNNPEVKIPKPRLLIGSDLYVDGHRWDQRLFPLVIRISGQNQPAMQTQVGIAPLEDNSIAQNFATQMGGRSFSLTCHRSLGPCIDQIIQRIQTNGVLVRFQKYGPNPPPPSNAKENEQSRKEDENDAWTNSLVLLKSKIGQQHSHWPIPESYWPDSIKNTLPPRATYPIIAFKCERVDPLFNTEFPLDKYELDGSSPLAQYILSRREPNLCWQVFVENSYRQPGLGYPFGYIKISTSSTVTLYVMPYNYPDLLTLLSLAKEPKLVNTVQFQQKFDRYLSTVPAYYYSGLKKALSRIKVMPPSLEEANTKLYGYCNLGALQMRIKNQGQQEFESACAAVYKNLQESVLFQNSALLVKVSRSRVQLAKNSLTDCTFRPAIVIYKSNVPADAFKDLSIFVLETPQQTVVPSLQFKNPFDISRTNLCSQLDKMRLNYEQQVQTNNLHVLEGGLPGQKIKLQHAEDLHNLPISKMGIYEDYMKSLSAIGLGPKRELEPQAARPHAFGNPFKLDKKNLSIVDEVGEVNASADGTACANGNNNNGNSNNERRERKRAASEGQSAAVRPKRRPGPLDSNRLASWKRSRRSRSIGFNDNASLSSIDLSDVQSESEEGELGELRLVDMEDEENEPEERESQQGEVIGMDGEIDGDGERMNPIATDSADQLPNRRRELLPSSIIELEIKNSEENKGEKNKRGEGMLLGASAFGTATWQSDTDVVTPSPSSWHHVVHQCHASTSEQSVLAAETGANNRKLKQSRKRGRTAHTALLPTLSETEFFLKKREVRQLIRQIGPRNDELHVELMKIVSDRALSKERRRELLELGHLEAKMFKRQVLVELIGSELQEPLTTTACKSNSTTDISTQAANKKHHLGNSNNHLQQNDRNSLFSTRRPQKQQHNGFSNSTKTGNI